MATREQPCKQAGSQEIRLSGEVNCEISDTNKPELSEYESLSRVQAMERCRGRWQCGDNLVPGGNAATV